MQRDTAAQRDTEAAPRNQEAVLIRLADLAAKRDALQRARDERAKFTPEEQLAIAERALAADEKLDALEQEHGRVGKAIAIVRIDDDADGRAVIVKRPNMTQFRKFQDSSTNTSKDIDLLVRPCVLWPSLPEYDQLVNELPFLTKRVADAVTTLAGVRKSDVSEK